MDFHLILLLAVAALLFAMTAALRLILDYRVKRRLIERPISDEAMRQILAPRQDAYAALKWGLAALSAGAALAMIELLGLSHLQPATYGLVLLAIGLALIAYYFIARRKLETRTEMDSTRAEWPSEPEDAE